MHIEISRHVATAPEQVWDVIADVAGSAHVIGAIDSVEMLAGTSPVELGTTWRETRTMLGRPATADMIVTAVDPGRSYTVRAHSNGTDYESTVSVEPAGDGAQLTMTLGATSTSMGSRALSATVGRLLVGATRKALEQDLADIAAVAELGLPRDGGGSGEESGGRPVGP